LSASLRSFYILTCGERPQQRSTNARRGRIADMTPLFTDGNGGVKPDMCRRPRAVLRPMLALCVSGFVCDATILHCPICADLVFFVLMARIF
jgi:hypothetical protein